MEEQKEQIYNSHLEIVGAYDKQQRVSRAKYIASIIGIVALPVACIVAGTVLTALSIMQITAIVVLLIGGITLLFVPKLIGVVHNEYQNEIIKQLADYVHDELALVEKLITLSENEEEQNNEQ